MYILSVGNSYSADQQQFVHQLAKASGADIEVHNAYIGGCTFEKHSEKLASGEKAYKHYKNGRVVRKNTTLEYIVRRRKWDYITFQCGTNGKSEITPDRPYLDKLIDYVSTLYPQAELVYNFSWPDGTDSERGYLHVAFDGDPQKQYAHILNCVREAHDALSISYVTPGGLAYNYAYPEFGNALHRDGFHMSECGRYLMACVWVEFFAGVAPSEDYTPKKKSYKGARGDLPTADECKRLRKYAHKAITEYKQNGGKTP